MSNIIVYTTPLPRKNGDELFLAAIAEAPEGPLGDLPDFIKRASLDKFGDYTTHLLPLTDIFTNEVVGEAPATHLALIESKLLNSIDGDPFKFGYDTINRDGILILWNEKDGAYYHFHCADCAKIVLQQLIKKQDAWTAASPRISSTLN